MLSNDENFNLNLFANDGHIIKTKNFLFEVGYISIFFVTLPKIGGIFGKIFRVWLTFQKNKNNFVV